MNDNIVFLPVDEIEFMSVVPSLSEITDWGQLFTGIPEAHKFSKGKGVTVAILDTGATDHIDVKDNVIDRFNCTTSPDCMDHQGHGTHVAGIVAAVENDMGIVGVAPEAKLIGIKVLGEGGTGGYEGIANGIRKAVELGADIINMSLGSPVAPDENFHAAIKEAYDKGVIIVAAAGNDAGAVNYPARFDEVIAVAAIDREGKLARFSSRGEQIKVAAPGVDVYSTYLNDQYAILNGTSQASPLVAGICALILSWSRNTEGIEPIKNCSEMLKMLDDLCDPQGRIGTTGTETNFGFGIPQFANFMPWRNK